MKFRYKVLAANVIVLSIALGILGYLLIYQNFTLALENQKRNALLQNNLIQSNVEYELLSIINSNEHSDKLTLRLPEIGTKLHGSIMSSDSNIYIYQNQTCYYQSSAKLPPIEKLIKNQEMGSKHFIINKKKQHYDMYVASMNIIQDKSLYVITQTDVSEVYSLMRRQITFFHITMISVLLFCCAIMYAISRMLSKPLENLNDVSMALSKGDYSRRATPIHNDEITQLAIHFNQMATSIQDHINELNAMIKQKEQFVADFTHELKTPMTSIIGYADLLRSKELSQERTMLAANYIFSEGKRLEIMSRKLFDLIYLSQNELECRECNTKNFMETVTKSVTPLLSQKNINYVVDVESANIFCEKDLLTTAFINMIDNAKKASKEFTTITIQGRTSNEDNHTYEFRIIDQGIGMDEETVSKVCNEFYMADKSRSRKEGGAGLGLSLAALIIKKCKGALQIESTPGIGTTMIITLPVVIPNDRNEEAQE